MIGQIYLSGRLSGDPEFSETRKGKPLARILLEADQVRATPTGPSVEPVTAPVILFSRQAEAIRSLRKGDFVTLSCHLNGTRFATPEGGVKHGLQLIADSVLWEKEAYDLKGAPQLEAAR
jgi:single-stranded DNA-binding protein